ncbi:MAG: hypothetical protein R3C39_06195 [Dehalococcoidia bacterium]
MQLRRFQGPTAAAAYERVREALGDEAIIVSTRTASVPGVLGGGGAQFVEVTAGIPDGVEPPPIRFDQDAAAHDLVRGMAEAAAMAPLADTETAQPVPRIEAPVAAIEADDDAEDDGNLAPPFENPLAGSLRRGEGDQLPPALVRAETEKPRETAPEPSPAIESTTTAAPASEGDHALLAAIAEQVADMREALGRLTAERTHARVDAGPELLHELRSRLIDQGLTPAAMVGVLDQVEAATTTDANVSQWLANAERFLTTALPPVADLSIGRGPATIFVVGAGGSGKTSVAVRLARMLAQRPGLEVALASIDVNRAGAPQQVIACGAAAGFEVELCYAPADLKALFTSGSANVVVVDTPGHNGTRRERLAELNAFLQAANRPSMLLTLSAMTHTTEALRLVSAFAPFGLTGLVPTRLDETSIFGGIASAAIESDVGIAFASASDALSEVLATGDNRALAHAVLAGRWPRGGPAPATATNAATSNAAPASTAPTAGRAAAA